ncbi:cellulose biosynthesis protein BcsO [Pantoea sp. Acro-805]|uniref:Cellulose biosynthesis protein BcsO n=1 Tax=Candidatus Pantoea formicae TaxID=2608355 RepID=A0ABX0R2E3_9GAMM|nr:cellulose biosynthesis protein BcsO [Pantoea formicae]MDF7649293.1 cellulose biosynthesis protein BcsO [Erwiniaceae bacterium L1_54_3]NIF02294.1 cellulose biosynthesis protein BcsO [Pantoea formicae]
MKNYDDLQRFKEKTKTLDIAFKDMSGQSQEADHSQWAIIRQLGTHNEPELGSGQRIDLPQPQPIRGDEFVAPAQPAAAAPLSGTTRGLILDSLAATATVESMPAVPPTGVSSLYPPAPAAKPAPAAIAQAPKATHVERQATTSLFPPAPAKPAAASVSVPVTAPSPVAATPAPVFAAAAEPARPAPAPTFATPAEPARPASAPSRFGALFRSRPAEPAHISKETPLKPLLEKIALCR